MEISKLIEHFLLSLLPWFAGVVFGGGLGVGVAFLLRLFFSAVPGSRWPLAFFPWRTIVFGLLVIIWTPFLVRELGLGPTFGGVTVGLAMFLLAFLSLTGMLLDRWHPAPLAARLAGDLRTLAAGAVVLAYGVGFLGGGGIGFTVQQYFQLLTYNKAWQGIAAVLGLLLLIDLVLGVPHFLLGFLVQKKRLASKTGRVPAV